MEYKQKIIRELNHYLQLLFPICRSITGNGNRLSLKILQRITPIEIKEIKSGTKVYDWVIPKEWNVKEAYIEDYQGNRIVDFDRNNLHLVSYSMKVNTIMTWEELKSHIFKSERNQEAIPYRTTYYERNWGFCVNAKQYQRLEKCSKPFKIVIDSSLKNGYMTYGECLIKGESAREILISCYICHPSMANDSLSGVIISAFLVRYLRSINLKWSYRIVFVPETIGSIAYCAINEAALKNIDVGLVITTAGGPGKISFKKSWNENHYINNLVKSLLMDKTSFFKEYPFDCHGSDERQYSSPGLRINCISIFKDKYYEYDSYHSSLDNLEFVKADNLYETYEIYKFLILKLEKQAIYKRVKDIGEIMLSKHNLYPKIGGDILPKKISNDFDLLLKVLFYIDGKLTIESIAEKINVNKSKIKKIINVLEEKNIIKNV